MLAPFRGTLYVTNDQAQLLTGGVSTELLAVPTVPGSAAEWAAARQQTVAQMGGPGTRPALIRGRQAGPYILDVTVAAASGIPSAGLAAAVALGGPKPFKADFTKVKQALQTNREKLLAIPGVVSVRPGFLFKNGWATRTPAIVVTVVPSRGLVGGRVDRASIPAKIDSVPVDVATATPAEQLLFAANRSTAMSALAATSDIPVERIEEARMKLDLPMPGMDETAAASASLGLATARRTPGGARRTTKPSPASAAVHYDPPPASLVELKPINGPLQVTLSASPDTGWPTLRDFFLATTNSLTRAMYDFTGPHILNTLKSVMDKATGKLQLVIDANRPQVGGGGDPEHNPKGSDFEESAVLDSLQRALVDRFDYTYAAVSRAGKSSGGIFKSAYHIKVAVRDSDTLWLSSGNWQSSNQPNFDPPMPQTEFPNLRRIYDRDWHIVVSHDGLAQTYEKFIEWDAQQAKPLEIAETALALQPPLGPDLFLSVPADLDTGLATAASSEYFASKTLSFQNTADITIQPVLTPDNYEPQILHLIQSAQHTLYLQNQYIKVPKDDSGLLRQLINAIYDCINRGVKVKIILRGDFDFKTMLEALVSDGFPPEVLKVQKGLHNKGIIVDSKVVAIGSQNWSEDGVGPNRDATLIIYNDQVAQYYEKIFLNDWETLATQRTPTGDAEMAVVTTASDPLYPDTARVPWGAVYDPSASGAPE